MLSDAATHEDRHVVLPPQSLDSYPRETRAARAALINFLAEPEDDEVPEPSQRATSTVKRSAAKANFEKKVAYPLRPVRSHFKSAAASSEQSPRPASNPVTSTLKKETEVGGHRPTRFLTIPPEIRNQIYDFVFKPGVGAVALLDARPPSKALPLLCRKIYNEVQFLHKAAYRAYWRDTQFTISPTTSPRSKMICTHADAASIRHINFKATLNDESRVYERWADGQWYDTRVDSGHHSAQEGLQHWCLSPLPHEGRQPFLAKLPKVTDVQWRELTKRELRGMLSSRYEWADS
ncbi:hypothetical protein LTR56_025134 [Elasticomyces elasticus]|nr:hypothetical protein LTR56_025134 [Elasticomyces elasticus]KAK3621308.1 hypothetical protein LTR22_025243 [Elasticomyces elasticus]KAK4904865.1 hypothetical protein LTR49_025756 [Elasticomyces elasticus]KAK5741019.1 hypothetical protein LTS12_024739 [Elasticomyces elasticus]